MSVTTNRALNLDVFEQTLAGPYTYTGGPLTMRGPKTVIAGEGVTEQRLAAAVASAADALDAREAVVASAFSNLRQSYSVLRQWSQDAATTNTNWPNMTAAQKDTATRETIRRLGVLLDRFGDLLQALNADA